MIFNGLPLIIGWFTNERRQPQIDRIKQGWANDRRYTVKTKLGRLGRGINESHFITEYNNKDKLHDKHTLMHWTCTREERSSDVVIRNLRVCVRMRTNRYRLDL
jgi:hypothetical protein